MVTANRSLKKCVAMVAINRSHKRGLLWLLLIVLLRKDVAMVTTNRYKKNGITVVSTYR